jgi:hypothetical protein
MMDGWGTLEDLYANDPKTYLTEMAEDLISLEMDGSDEKTGEMFPDWCLLVVTPSIEKTIDWDCVRSAVIEMYEDRLVDDLFGDDE